MLTKVKNNFNLPIELLEEQLLFLAKEIYNKDIENNKKMALNGVKLVPENARILTHCNAGALATCGIGTALGVIREAHLNNKIDMVYVDETRPLLQGARLTAWELMQDNIPTTLITDNMAAWTIKTKKVDLIIVGADRIALNGDVANKIGTYNLALLAKFFQIPFYVAAPLSTFDFTLSSGDKIPIEERKREEVVYIKNELIAPSNINVFNPAFDVTPNDLVSGIITEHAVIKPPYTKKILDLKQIKGGF
jgi:methylthioribose-1-phosphate isomerase